MSLSRKEYIFQISLILVAITIPLSNNLNSWAIVVFCISAFFLTNGKSKLRALKEDKFWILPAIYFLWLALTGLWDKSNEFAVSTVESYATFLVIPAILTIIPKQRLVVLRKACLFFVITVIIITIVCLVKSTIDYNQQHDFRVFYYHYLAQQAGLNAIFLSNYCVTSIVWLLYDRFIIDGEKKRLSLSVTVVACLYLAGYVFLLSSKMVIFLLLVMLIVLALMIGYKRKKLLLSVSVLIIFGACSALAISRLPYLNWRLRVTEFKKYQSAADDQNGFAARLVMWQSAAELIAKRPLLGYGIKGSKDALLEKYKEKNFQVGIEGRYNSHNQFLETTLMGGAVAAILFISILAFITIHAIKYRKILLLLLLIHYTAVSLVEATLEVQQELVFFWFFIFLFYYHFPSSIRANAYKKQKFINAADSRR